MYKSVITVLKPGDEIIAIDPRYFRPTEVDLLLGDSTRAKTILGWNPKHDVNSLLAEMVDGRSCLDAQGYTFEAGWV